MCAAHASRLERPVDRDRDHVLGPPEAEMTLLEYGSYACPYCHAAHEIIARLRDRFGERMRYVFRQRPITGSDDALRAAIAAEYAGAASGRFWAVHDALMRGGPDFGPDEIDQIVAGLGVEPIERADPVLREAAEERVREDARSAVRSGATASPTFFVDGRRYEGAWDESSLAEAMLGSLGHRLHAASLDFARWAPSTGVLLLAMSILAVAIANSPWGEPFASLWETPLTIGLGDASFSLPLRGWVDDGLLTIFFVVVGLEIKREVTVGRLATRSAAALPVAASIGGMLAPALLYLAIVPAGPLTHGWATTVSTDTAFAVALIAALGARVPVALRVFLTAAVIVDDLLAIAIIAIFYSGEVDLALVGAAAGVSALLVALSRWGVYRALPYAVLGVVLWSCLHAAGIHATLAGVILAIVTPTRPPPNLNALMAQAEMAVDSALRSPDHGLMRHGLSEPTLRALDAVHDRIESPASRLLRTIEPWSSYVVLPLFALANAGVVWMPRAWLDHVVPMVAIIVGLVVGKPLGMFVVARLAVASGLAHKPDAYSWAQLAGASALAGMGFTMSLFIARQSFADDALFAAAKSAIFAASLLAAAAGVAILVGASRRKADHDEPAVAPAIEARIDRSHGPAQGRR